MPCLAFGGGGGAQIPQGTPDAGTVLKQIERQNKNIDPRKIPPKIEQEEESKTKPRDEGVVEFFVKNIVVSGNTLILSKNINLLFSNLLNTTVTIDELKLAMDEVTLLYQDKGYIGRATLPQQDITDGVITVEIREGIFGGAELLTDPDVNYLVNPVIIKQYIESSLSIGSPVDTNKLERAILIASDLPGVLVNQSLQAGKNPGETDSGVRMINEPWFLGSLTNDNFGSKTTGYNQTLLSSSLLSPNGFGDRIDIALLKTEGVDYGSITYALPIGYSGLTLGMNASLMSYDVVNGEATTLELSGVSRTLSIDATYPLIRSRTNNLNLTSSLEAKEFINKSSFGTESDYLSKTFNVGVNYLDLTDWLMGGEFVGSINIALGHNDYGNSSNTFQTSKKNDNTDGLHGIFSSNINFTQFFDDENFAAIQLSTQYGNKNLDSSQKFFLGGERGVRAYPASEAGGTHGILLKVDYNYLLTSEITAIAFYDHGYAKQYKTDYNPATNQPLTLAGNSNSISLRGYGFSFEYLGPKNTTFKATWSDRIGSNPNRTTNNLDNSNAEAPGPMVWVSGAINF